MKGNGTWRIWLIGVMALLQAACAGLHPLREGADQAVYVVARPDAAGLAARHAPVFVVGGQNQPANRIGTPAARLDEAGRSQIFVDPATPTVYFQEQSFSTAQGTYTNLIYRVHFPEVPFSLVPLQLTAGKNVGLLVVITLNDRQEPVLVTTLHTCGCYLAIIPTSFLPAAAYPADWRADGQRIYGVTLPGRLVFDAGVAPRLNVEIAVRDGDHRVADVRPLGADATPTGSPARDLILRPMADLTELPLDGGASTSFFEEQGSRRGYVKGSQKPIERLLMGWWALDLHVGEDKALGPTEETGVVLYTSLKPWARCQSDLWHFADFLRYWGWKL
ncbi:MAG: hypothetical protein COZ12_00300 [Deltaproteobacteria bacterium CG_4_10_14_3_um_filter_60_8]|nr:MAG: hypothetical protein AUK28_05650 [Desulfobacterales bacterium CG2_30_60_27]PIY25251.1 MAG: hypothetical protein COZ12_00300 [Deltaproteobacteria bacterium CG_4_10_14_3_um_filter_60_8]